MKGSIMKTNKDLIEEARKWVESALPPSPWADTHIVIELANALEAKEQRSFNLAPEPQARINLEPDKPLGPSTELEKAIWAVLEERLDDVINLDLNSIDQARIFTDLVASVADAVAPESPASAYRVLSATGRLRQQKSNRIKVLGVDVVKEISAASQAALKNAPESTQDSKSD